MKKSIFVGIICFSSVFYFTATALSFKFGEVLRSLDVKKIAKIAKSTIKAFQDFNEEEQYYVGRSTGAQLLANYKLHPPGDFQDYISQIGQTLAMASDRPETFKGHHFIVLREPNKVNAFAVPGGFIFITTGLIAKAANEDEIAGILAHELSHIVLKHPTNSIKKSYRDQLKKDILSLAADQVSGDKKIKELVKGMNKLSDMIIDSAAKGYSRKKENVADAEAVTIMINAGYNPMALSDVLKKLNPVGRGKSGTHGNPIKRSKKVLNLISDLKTIPAFESERNKRFNQIVLR